MTSSVLDVLTAAKIVPVVVIDDATAAIDVATALVEGGIKAAEITLRTDAGLASISSLADLSDFIVGAGTVLTTYDVDRCVDAGARFIVSPGFDRRIVERAQELGVAVLPGVATATELQAAAACGLDHVKFFPADRLGGLDTISALAGPFPGMHFLPSGGVSPANAREYLTHPSVFAIGGSWMVSRKMIFGGEWQSISRLSRQAVDLVAE